VLFIYLYKYDLYLPSLQKTCTLMAQEKCEFSVHFLEQ